METLTQKTQRYARELELEIRAANTRGAIELVEAWSLSHDARLAVARALDQRLRLPQDEDPVLLRRGPFDQAHINRLVKATRRA